jgi:hypothetical protein
MTMLQIGIVVPTLGTRPEFLEQCLRSIRQSGDCWIALVVPNAIDISRFEEMGLCNQRVDDPKKGLAMAINAGIMSLPSEIEFVNWLGDDDLLEPASLNYMARLLHDKQADFAWGKCRYISGDGQTIGMNRSGTWAKWLIRVGPNLIPQPGSLFTRRAFNAEGCLTDNYGWAFDQELFTKFVRSYRTLYVPKIVASFRWHSGSLSAGARNGSVRESSQIRIANMPTIVRPISRLWEPMICWVISLAGQVVTIRANKTKS